MSKERDLYLDFYRGLAVISIIWIHTVWWSGESYTPHLLRNMALLLDVPFFMFLSGWSFSYNPDALKQFKNLFVIWLKWSFFLIIVHAFLHIVSETYRFPVLPVLLRQSFFIGKIPTLPVIMGSIWFMPMYMTILAVAALLANWKAWESRNTLKLVFVFSLTGLCYLSIDQHLNYFYLSSYFCFYTPFFILGYTHATLQGTSTKQFCFTQLTMRLMFICAGSFFLSLLYDKPLLNLQKVKFPPHILYFTESLISINLACFLHGKIDQIVRISKLICFLGKNSLCFFFAQGIGSSLLFHIAPLINCHWSIKVLTCFVINCFLTIFIGLALYHIYLFLMPCICSTIRNVSSKIE